MADIAPVNNDLITPTTTIQLGTFCKVVANRTVGLCATLDADVDVVGVFMANRQAGAAGGMPVLTAEGYQVDVRCTGIVAPGDRVSLSNVSPGYCMKSPAGSVGLGVCVQGGTNTLITIVFEGHAGGSGSTSVTVPLLAYNLTLAPIALLPTAIVLPASLTEGLRGPAVDVTAAFSTLTPADFAALQLQANPNGEVPLNVQYEWNGLPTYPTPGLAAGTPDTFIAEDDFLVWVSPTGVVGAGGTPSNPTTIADFFQRMPSLWRKRCQMIQLPGTYNWPGSANGAGFQTQIGAPVGNQGSPFVILGDFTNEQGDRTSDQGAPSEKSIFDSTLAMAFDQYRRFFVTIYDAGGNPLQSREIIGNDATTIFVNDKFNPPAAAGDIFRIEQPSVVNVMNDPNGVAVLFPGNSGLWGMKGIHWHSEGFFLMAYAGSGLAATERCMYSGDAEFGPLAVFVNEGAESLYASFPPPWASDGANNPFDFSRFQASATFDSCLLQYSTGAVGHLFNFNIFDRGFGLVLQTGSHVDQFAQLNMRSGFGGLVIQSGASASIVADTSLDPILATIENTSDDAVKVQTNGVLEMAVGANNWQNNGNSGLHVLDGGVVEELDATSGTGNAAYGLEIGRQGQVVWNQAGITLAGTLGEVKVGNRAPSTWANVGIFYPAPATIWDIREPELKPLKFTITQPASDTIDFDALTLPRCLQWAVLRVTGATSPAAIAIYGGTDSGGTAVTGPNFGVAIISDDGNTITFAAGSQVTDFTIIYSPVDPAFYTGAQLINNAV